MWTAKELRPEILHCQGCGRPHGKGPNPRGDPYVGWCEGCDPATERQERADDRRYTAWEAEDRAREEALDRGA